jgi:hypothetical protein
MNNKYISYTYIFLTLLISLYIQVGAGTIVEFILTSLVTFLPYICIYYCLKNITHSKLPIKLMRIGGVILSVALIIVMCVYANFRQFNSYACKRDLIGKNIFSQDTKTYCNFIPWYAEPIK